PNVVPALTEFVRGSSWYFVLVVLATVLTLIPQLRRQALDVARGFPAERRGSPERLALHPTRVARGAPDRLLSVLYIVVWCSIGAFAVVNPPLATIANRPAAFVTGLVALVPPIWIAIIDHLAQPAPVLRPTGLSRMFAVCLASAVAAWACY